MILPLFFFELPEKILKMSGFLKYLGVYWCLTRVSETGLLSVCLPPFLKGETTDTRFQTLMEVDLLELHRLPVQPFP
jgi:hypothetical protein